MTTTTTTTSSVFPLFSFPLFLVYDDLGGGGGGGGCSDGAGVMNDYDGAENSKHNKKNMARVNAPMEITAMYRTLTRAHTNAASRT